jgi:DNA-binding MarR family transcriptional regulator
MSIAAQSREGADCCPPARAPQLTDHLASMAAARTDGVARVIWLDGPDVGEIKCICTQMTKPHPMDDHSEQADGSLLLPGHCISNNLQKTARAVSRLYAEEMRPAGLARSQFAILGTLEHAGALPLSELAGRLYMERTTLTRNLAPLERAGLLERRADEADARVRQVAITSAGRAKLREARRYWRRAQQRTLALFGQDEWRSLEASLRSLRRLVK